MLKSLRTPHSRRAFLESLGLAGTALLLPTASYASQRYSTGFNEAPLDFADPDLKALATRAIEAATRAGATYADVRITQTSSQDLTPQSERDSHERIAGVRVLANGAWGFAAHIDMDPDTMAWLGTTCTELAKANAWPSVPPVTMDPTPSVTGTWQTPVDKDPFTVTNEEKADFTARMAQAVQASGGKGLGFQVGFQRQDRLFVSSEGSFTNQRIYHAFNDQPRSMFFSPSSWMSVETQDGAQGSVTQISPIGAGWEALTDCDKYMADAMEHAGRAGDAIDLDQPGRYECVFDGAAMAAFVSTFGCATEIDRALGMEASLGQMSFLSPIQEKIGKSLLGPSVTITADRKMPKGAASVAWDDEGVAPSSFVSVKDGVLMDYGKGREAVPEIAAWYKQHGRTSGSLGCMVASGAKFMPLVSTPNLTLAPATQDTSFDDLLSGINYGFAFLGGNIDMDNQLITGWGRSPRVYLIEKGKLTKPVRRAAYTFSMLDHWKNLVALGGQRSVMMKGFSLTKGAPSQVAMHSVSACAGRFKDVAVRSLGIPRVF